MRKLHVDLDELAMAFEDASRESSYFLDLETGQVVWISDETRRQLERIYEQAGDQGSDEAADLTKALQDFDLHSWQKGALLEANQVEQGFGDQYIRVPHADSHDAYRDTERFIATVHDTRLQNLLWHAICPVL